MEILSVNKVYSFTCDECGKVAQGEEFPKEWIRVAEVNKHSLRLFEKPSTTTRYETFHIPGKENKDYCNPNCAFENYKKSFDLFFRELKPIRHDPSKSKPLH